MYEYGALRGKLSGYIIILVYYIRANLVCEGAVACACPPAGTRGRQARTSSMLLRSTEETDPSARDVAFIPDGDGFRMGVGRQAVQPDAVHTAWLTLAIADTTVSRRHAEIRVGSDDTIALTQLGPNGTGVRSQDGIWKTVWKSESQSLQVGDTLCFLEKARSTGKNPVMYCLCPTAGSEGSSDLTTATTDPIDRPTVVTAPKSAALDVTGGAVTTPVVDAATVAAARLAEPSADGVPGRGRKRSIRALSTAGEARIGNLPEPITVDEPLRNGDAMEMAAASGSNIDDKAATASGAHRCSRSAATRDEPIVLLDSQPDDSCVWLSDSPADGHDAPGRSMLPIKQDSCTGSPSQGRGTGRRGAAPTDPRAAIYIDSDDEVEEQILPMMMHARSRGDKPGGPACPVTTADAVDDTRLDAAELYGSVLASDATSSATAQHSVTRPDSVVGSSSDATENVDRIIIDLDDIDDSDEDGEDDLGGSQSAIDLEADEKSLARQLSRLGGGRNGAKAIDLEALQDARRQRLDARRGTAHSSVEAIDVEDEANVDLLYEQRNGIDDFLKATASDLKVSDVWHNPASKPGGKLYDRFFAAWATAPTKRMRLCFHGTMEQNIESICQNGLDPKRRAGQAHGRGEYFGANARVSLGYCRGGRKMLVFVVLCDPSGITTEGVTAAGDIIVVNKPEFQVHVY